MRTKKRSYLLFSIFMLSLIVLGNCVSTISTQDYSSTFLSQTQNMPITKVTSPYVLYPIFTREPLQKSSSTTSPLSTLTPIFPIPTLLSEQASRLYEILYSKACKFPCYLGIIPGKTSLNDGEAILDKLGAKYIGKYIRRSDQATADDYVAWVGMPTEKEETLGQEKYAKIISYDISLSSTSGIIQSIDTLISAYTITESSHKYLSIFTAKEIFKNYGPPDEIYLKYNNPKLPFLGHELLLAYKKPGIIIVIYGNEEENNICSEPGYEANFITIALSFSFR